MGAVPEGQARAKLPGTVVASIALLNLAATAVMLVPTVVKGNGDNAVAVSCAAASKPMGD